jgi:hypothetical protein
LPKGVPGINRMERAATAEAGPLWLRDFFPGYFALVMGTGIVAHGPPAATSSPGRYS